MQSQSSYKLSAPSNFNIPVMNIQGRGLYAGKN